MTPVLPADLLDWDAKFLEKARALYPVSDPAHDLLHIRRVVENACRLAREEGADLYIVLPAAYFHDFVTVPKNDTRRSVASRLSAVAAIEYLGSIGYPEKYFDGIRHAIEAHSFSANISPGTIEAKVVQDADRLDANGAIGIARCFAVNAQIQTAFYDPDDFLHERRDADDGKFAVDHFFIKLFKLPEMMNTASARAEGERRVVFMKEFLKELQREVS